MSRPPGTSDGRFFQIRSGTSARGTKPVLVFAACSSGVTSRPCGPIRTLIRSAFAVTSVRRAPAGTCSHAKVAIV